MRFARTLSTGLATICLTITAPASPAMVWKRWCSRPGADAAHANAPGYGDPPSSRIGDCRTQRNLDERGRAQARATGERLRALGIREARVYSSQWCRAWKPPACSGWEKCANCRPELLLPGPR